MTPPLLIRKRGVLASSSPRGGTPLITQLLLLLLFYVIALLACLPTRCDAVPSYPSLARSDAAAATPFSELNVIGAEGGRGPGTVMTADGAAVAPVAFTTIIAEWLGDVTGDPPTLETGAASPSGVSTRVNGRELRFRATNSAPLASMLTALSNVVLRLPLSTLETAFTAKADAVVTAMVNATMISPAGTVTLRTTSLVRVVRAAALLPPAADTSGIRTAIAAETASVASMFELSRTADSNYALSLQHLPLPSGTTPSAAGTATEATLSVTASGSTTAATVFDELVSKAIVVEVAQGAVWDLPYRLTIPEPSATVAARDDVRLTLKAVKGSSTNPRIVVLRIGAQQKTVGYQRCLDETTGSEDCFPATPRTVGALGDLSPVMQSEGANRCWLSGSGTNNIKSTYAWRHGPYSGETIAVPWHPSDPNEGSAAGITFNRGASQIRDRQGTSQMDSTCCYCYGKTQPVGPTISPVAIDGSAALAAVPLTNIFRGPHNWTTTRALTRTQSAPITGTRPITATYVPPLRTPTPSRTRSGPTVSATRRTPSLSTEATDSVALTESGPGPSPSTSRSLTKPPTPTWSVAESITTSVTESETVQTPPPTGLVESLKDRPPPAEIIAKPSDATGAASTTASAAAAVVAPSAASKPTAMQRMSSTISLCADSADYEDDGFPSVYNFVPWQTIGENQQNVDPRKVSPAKISALSAATGACVFTSGCMAVAAIATFMAAKHFRFDKADSASKKASARAARVQRLVAHAERLAEQAASPAATPPSDASLMMNRRERMKVRRQLLREQRRGKEQVKREGIKQLVQTIASTLMVFSAAFFAPSIAEAIAFVAAAPEATPSQRLAAVVSSFAGLLGLMPFAISSLARWTPVTATGLNDQRMKRVADVSRPSTLNAFSAIGWIAVDGTRNPLALIHRGVGLIDVIVAVLIALCSGLIRGQGNAICGWAPILMVVLAMIFLLYMCIVRPFEDRLELVCIIVLAALQVMVSALVAVALLVDSSYAETAENAAFAAEMATIGVPVVLAAWALRNVGPFKKICGDDSDDDEEAVKANDGAGSHSHHSGGGGDEAPLLGGSGKPVTSSSSAGVVGPYSPLDGAPDSTVVYDPETGGTHTVGEVRLAMADQQADAAAAARRAALARQRVPERYLLPGLVSSTGPPLPPPPPPPPSHGYRNHARSHSSSVLTAASPRHPQQRSRASSVHGTSHGGGTGAPPSRSMTPSDFSSPGSMWSSSGDPTEPVRRVDGALPALPMLAVQNASGVVPRNAYPAASAGNVNVAVSNPLASSPQAARAYEGGEQRPSSSAAAAVLLPMAAVMLAAAASPRPAAAGGGQRASSARRGKKKRPISNDERAAL